jgi:pilus assembly protein FimV
MSRGQNPLVLMMALSLPGTAHALGLGEIHVNSALNEPLAADIEIVGATAEELSSLTASIANRDTFLRFGATRPAFLASATFKVSRDERGRPVLLIRSTDSFTEPLVDLLVDLRWHNGEVIRQYSLLLDPAGFPAAPQLAGALHAPAVLVQTPARMSAPMPVQAAAVADVLVTRATTHVKIGAKATLRGVAWRVGARSDSDLKKTMLAIFRTNPHAFEGNINRLRRGAVLTIPSTADVAAIPHDEANREIQAQMTAWSGSSRGFHAVVAPMQTAQARPPGVSTTESTNAVDASNAAGQPTNDAAIAAALNLRVQSLEQGLHELQGRLQREHDKLLGVQAQVRYAQIDAPVAAAPHPRQWWPAFLMGGAALLAGAGALVISLRRRPKISAKSVSTTGAPMVGEISNDASEHGIAVEPAPRPAPLPIFQAGELDLAAWSAEAAAPPKHILSVNEDELRASYEDTIDLSGETALLAAEMDPGSGDTANLPAATVNLNAHTLQLAAAAGIDESSVVDQSATVPVSGAETRIDTTKLDYNLMDLDLTAQHVHMPSVLHERVVLKERRTNLVDVLKKAVEREPDRRDLRMKLLETYYAAAATNRLAFLEVVQKLACDRDLLGEGEWDKIAVMGRQIASDTVLFASEPAENNEKLADCA